MLQPGGRIALSVWGGKENMDMFTMAVEILKKYNLKLPTVRSNFHMHDKEKLITFFEDNGFENVLAWN